MLDWPPVRFSVGQSGFETLFPATGTALAQFVGFFSYFLLSYFCITNEYISLNEAINELQYQQIVFA